MAEAHQAVAFQFTVTPEGLDFHLSREAVKQFYLTGISSWKKRLVRAKVGRRRPATRPSAPRAWGTALRGDVPSCPPAHRVPPHPLCPRSRLLTYESRTMVSAALFSTGVWLSAVLLFRQALKLLLSYHGWMFEPHGKMSRSTKIWVALMKVLSIRKPLLYSFQTSLPKLPVPPVEATITRYLESVRPLMDDEKYSKMEVLAKEFKEKTAPRLQKYLILKSWWTTNYSTAGWRGCSRMGTLGPPTGGGCGVGWGMGTVGSGASAGRRASPVPHPHGSWCWTLGPPLGGGCGVRWGGGLGGLCRTVGVTSPTLSHSWCRTLGPPLGGGCGVGHGSGLEGARRMVVDLGIASPPRPDAGGAGRVPWAEARARFFSHGKNKASLDAIERAAFFLTLDEEEHGYSPGQEGCMDAYAKSLLHGQCYDRWFDKSFTLVVYKNGKLGANAEHSWADAPIIGHLWEVTGGGGDTPMGLPKDGSPHWARPAGTQGLGTPSWVPPEVGTPSAGHPCRASPGDGMGWDGMGTGTGMGTGEHPPGTPRSDPASPQDKGCFCLTYEASMTRLFREGRTETVRSCTAESTAFVRSMGDARQTRAERQRLFKLAADKHQHMYRMAMTGAGIDRHLFCLYVVSRYLGVESPFLAQVLSEPWRLSTSQTPQQQLKLCDLNKHPDHVSTGGGFGPVADDGYGVSYIIAGENLINFHVSSKFSSSETDSKRFGRNIRQAMLDIAELFD
ncbi:Carnitine O-palmitoyltransferase 1, muscle isoform, partial [Nipponia nippon]